jgi:hypothetical protein
MSFVILAKLLVHSSLMSTRFLLATLVVTMASVAACGGDDTAVTTNDGGGAETSSQDAGGRADSGGNDTGAGDDGSSDDTSNMGDVAVFDSPNDAPLAPNDGSVACHKAGEPCGIDSICCSHHCDAPNYACF